MKAGYPPLVAALTCTATLACSGATPPAGQGAPITAYVTAYTYYSNTPPGSATVSNPVIHRVAGGTGTWEDPVTVAVGHVTQADGSTTLDYPPGSRFYFPHLQRYFIVEDTCGDGPRPQDGPCHTGYPEPATTWLDIWVDGKGLGEDAARLCAEGTTGIHEVIRDPAVGQPVNAGSLCS